MRLISNHTPWVAGVILAACSMAFLAPVAEAGHRWRRGGEVRVVRRFCAPAPAVHYVGPPACGTYFVRRSSAGPVIAGFLGGLFLGASLASAAPAGYEYYDPYCRESFVTLDLYYGHLRHHHHPRMVRVIELDSGRCIHSYRYRDGGWEGCDGEDEDGDG